MRSTRLRYLACGLGLLPALLAGSSPSADAADPPLPPVVWLHYDYMVSADPAEPHSHEPNEGSIRLVVEAFRRRGIRLQVDPHHTAIPEVSPIALGIRVHGAVDFGTLKAAYFHPAGNHAWHYCIFAHDVVREGGLVVSGQSEIGGYDFAVGIGHFFYLPRFPSGFLFRPCPPDEFDPDCELIEGGTFMHELGHNFGLLHGGGDDVNYKPNYISVMNYLFTAALDPHGIPFGDAPEDAVPTGLRLDYSDRALPDLDENHVDERVGVGGPADSTDFTSIPFFGLVDGVFRFTVPLPSHGPIDWNLDGVIDSDVAWDANFSRLDLGHTYGTLTGFDDWGHIAEVLRTPDYVRGLRRSAGTAH